MSKARRTRFAASVCSFSYGYFRDPTIPREKETRTETDIWERWKELSTVLKISLRYGCLSKGNAFACMPCKYPQSRHGAAWQRQIMPQCSRVTSAIHANFYEIFMKPTRCARERATREVRRRRQAGACPWSTEVCCTNLMSLKRLHLQTRPEAFSETPFVSVTGLLMCVYTYARACRYGYLCYLSR